MNEGEFIPNMATDSDASKAQRAGEQKAANPSDQIPRHAEPVSVPMLAADRPRDRIVILGRRRAGKTLYLATLYKLLWDSKERDLSMKAIQGTTHTSCMKIIQRLQDGKWPDPTVGTQFLDFEVTFYRHKSPLVALDYSGEIFRQAFVTNVPDPATQELIAHIDQAAGIILLIDPKVVRHTDHLDRADDSFGLLKAVERVRTSVGGMRVPIAVVFTKYDARKAFMENNVSDRDKAGFATEKSPDRPPSSEQSQLKDKELLIAAFFHKFYGPLARELKEYKCFGASVCGETVNENKIAVPVIKGRPPSDIVQPLRYVMKQLAIQDQEREIQEVQRLAQDIERKTNARSRKQMIKVIALTAAIAIFVLGSIIIWVLRLMP